GALRRTDGSVWQVITVPQRSYPKSSLPAKSINVLLCRQPTCREACHLSCRHPNTLTQPCMKSSDSIKNPRTWGAIAGPEGGPNRLVPPRFKSKPLFLASSSDT